MYNQGARGPLDSTSIICSINIFQGFFLNIFSHKHWQGGGGLLFKVGVTDGY